MVSVVIPCYNVEKYITRALDSVYNQTYKDIEVICINDGSNDNTLQIINEYIKESSMNIKVFTTENRGVSSARNTGIEKAQGKYIMFLDADDAYGEETVFTLIKEMIDKDTDTAYGYWTSNEEELWNGNEDYFIEKKEKDDVMKFFMYRPKKVSFVNFIYKKKIIDDNEIKFPAGIKYGEDNEFFWKYVANIKSAVYIDRPMYLYYQNMDSALHSVTWDITMAMQTVRNISKYLKEKDCLFFKEYSAYMPARTAWSIAKEFARYKKKKMFLDFVKEENLEKKLAILKKSEDKLLSLSASIFVINPMFFYYMIQLYYLFERR